MLLTNLSLISRLSDGSHNWNYLSMHRQSLNKYTYFNIQVYIYVYNICTIISNMRGKLFSNSTWLERFDDISQIKKAILIKSNIFITCYLYLY